MVARSLSTSAIATASLKLSSDRPKQSGPDRCGRASWFRRVIKATGVVANRLVGKKQRKDLDTRDRIALPQIEVLNQSAPPTIHTFADGPPQRRPAIEVSLSRLATSHDAAFVITRNRIVKEMRDYFCRTRLH